MHNYNIRMRIMEPQLPEIGSPHQDYFGDNRWV